MKLILVQSVLLGTGSVTMQTASQIALVLCLVLGLLTQNSAADGDQNLSVIGLDHEKIPDQSQLYETGQTSAKGPRQMKDAILKSKSEDPKKEPGDVITGWLNARYGTQNGTVW
ncbi:uncharacterized protein LOC133519555 [Cydia pomonella]|uniref:uncharacterized protein LOC133519555 n=1 Tax=Cydia pomonella TaxID=82600 RepID=UPI002ADD8327|nr:uncharacterized protein LOC133519555 [Cydia pomonella]